MVETMNSAKEGPFCWKCRSPASKDGPALKQCSACHIPSYCSIACQRAAWRMHKDPCKAIVKNLARSEPWPVDVVMDPTLRAELDPDGETIYYIRTSAHWLDEIEISGPYPSFQAVLAMDKFITILARYSLLGTAHFEKETQQAAEIDSFVSITAPLDEDLEKKMTVELIRRHDPVMQQRLPTVPVFNVFMAYPKNPDQPMQSETGFLHEITKLEVVQSFLSKDEARAAAKDTLLEEAERLGPAEWRVCQMEPEPFAVGLVHDNKFHRIVQVVRDWGCNNKGITLPGVHSIVS